MLIAQRFGSSVGEYATMVFVKGNAQDSKAKMSLNYDATMVKGLDTLHEDETEALKTAYLCFVLNMAGVRSITVGNVEDVAKRVTFWERINGAVLRNGTQPFYYTAEDVRARVGYTTNVTDVPLSKWLKTVWENAGVSIG